MAKKNETEIGDVYNRLTLLSIEKQGKYRYGVFRCECGNLTVKKLSHVSSGVIKSCGCLQKESARGRSTKHGLRNHLLYGVWKSIIQRCYNINDPGYAMYGAKGVIMWDEWRNDFKKFYDWCIENGWQKGLVVDKDIIPKQNGTTSLVYSPETCSIVTPTINSRNRSSTRFVEYKGVEITIGELSEKCGLSYHTIKGRIDRGWGIEIALNKPKKRLSVAQKARLKKQ